MRSTYSGTRLAFLVGSNYVQSSSRQVDWDQIPDSFRQGAVLVTCGANAAQNATTISLTVPTGTTLPKGAVLDFGGGKFARLGQAVVGDGTEQAGIVVDALVTALVDLDTAYYSGNAGPKYIPAGTIMAELDNGMVVPRRLIVRTFEAARTADAGNTGDGVMTLAAVPAGAQVGTYRVVFVEPTANLGTFIVEDPSGVEIGTGVVGTAFSNQIAFTIADGATDFIAGDAISVAVTETEDGAICAGLILTDATQNSLTDAASGYGMVVSGVVIENALPDAVAGVITAAQKAALNGMGLGFLFETYVDDRA